MRSYRRAHNLDCADLVVAMYDCSGNNESGETSLQKVRKKIRA